MNIAIGAKPPVWFRIAGILALLWNLVGVVSYLSHVGVLDLMPGNPAGEAMPVWAIAAYAIGVFASALGALGLVIGKAWTYPLLWVSLVALLVDWGWVMLASGVGIMPLGIMVLVIAALLVWMANMGVKRGWLS